MKITNQAGMIQVHILEEGTHFLPTMIRIASCIIVRARASIESGNVALNRDRIIEGLEQASTTESITSTNPSSKSLSDSSKTRYSKLQNKVICYLDFRLRFTILKEKINSSSLNNKITQMSWKPA